MVVAQQVAILILFISIGYVLRKTNIVPQSGASVLSKLLFFVFMPALNFNTFATQFTIDVFSGKYIILIYGLVIMLAVAVASKFAAKLFSKDKYERGIYTYTLTVPNFGFGGYALMQSLYGDEMLMNMMIFVIPLTIYTYTEGYRLLIGLEHVSFKSIINPAIIAIVIGAVVGLIGIDLPVFIGDAVKKAADCMSPASMIMTGLVIAEFDLKEMLLNKKSYIVSAVRLIVMPVIICTVLRLINAPQSVLLSALMTYAMSTGLNTILFPKLIDRDCKPGASFAIISSVLSIATISLVTGLFT